MHNRILAPQFHLSTLFDNQGIFQLPVSISDTLCELNYRGKIIITELNEAMTFGRNFLRKHAVSRQESERENI